jgi:uncharacterized membrane protein YjjP (DUF1212 family)
MKGNEFLSLVMDIGEQMLVSGAEINRVEDSISRICKAYNAVRVDVFTITSSIVVTLQLEEGYTTTQTRRINDYRTNLSKLDKLNNLSRYICQNQPTLEYIRSELEKISLDKPYSTLVQHMTYALIAGAFTMFFGGNFVDAMVAAVIGANLKWLISLIERVDINLVLVNLLCSFMVGILAVIAVQLGIGHDAEQIMIGNIMLLIPGIALTNSIRDIISGHTMSGMLRLSEAIVLASFVAIGFGLAETLFRGVFQ